MRAILDEWLNPEWAVMAGPINSTIESIKAGGLSRRWARPAVEIVSPVGRMVRNDGPAEAAECRTKGLLADWPLLHNFFNK